LAISFINLRLFFQATIIASQISIAKKYGCSSPRDSSPRRKRRTTLRPLLPKLALRARMRLEPHPLLLLLPLLRRAEDALGARRMTGSLQLPKLALRTRMSLKPHPLLLLLPLLRRARDALGASRKRPANDQSNRLCPCLLP
jgi:hypothetical protein